VGRSSDGEEVDRVSVTQVGRSSDEEEVDRVSVAQVSTVWFGDSGTKMI
jgi:hypothetical protein